MSILYCTQGDHTSQVVQLAKDRSTLAAEQGEGSKAADTWILIDGPYGQQSFNHRQYAMQLLVGGGIGITPVMGMLKDIYDIGLPAEMQSSQPHCVDTIYFMWVLPNLNDYELFREDLDECMRKATEPGPIWSSPCMSQDTNRTGTANCPTHASPPVDRN